MPQLISIGELIDRSWDQYRARFSAFMTISVWALVIALLYIVAFSFYPLASKLLTGEVLNNWEIFGMVLFALTNIIVAPILGFWVFLSLVRLARGVVAGGQADTKKAARDGWKFFLPSALVSILTVLVVIGGVAVCVAPGVILGILSSYFSNSILAFLTTLVFIIGLLASAVIAIRWGVHYFFASYALLLEEKHGRTALTRSHHLIKGRFWSALLRMLVPKIVFMLVGALALFIVMYLTNVILSAVAGLNLDIYLRLATITQSTLLILMTVFINPLLVIADTLLYNNLVQTKK